MTTPTPPRAKAPPSPYRGVKTRWHVSVFMRGNPKPHKVEIFRRRATAIAFAFDSAWAGRSVHFEIVDTRAISHTARPPKPKGK